MDRNDIGRQALIEHGMLKEIAGALRTTMQWKPAGDDASRKLNSLRFIAESFQRHLEHVLTLEEYDGYMSVVTESYPHLTEKTERLRVEHDEFRDALRGLLYRLGRVGQQDLAPLADVCTELGRLLDWINDHNQREMSLIQEAFLFDEGGEG